MTNKERVISAINHVQTEKLPYCVGFVDEEFHRVADYLGDPNFMSDYNNHISQVYYSGDSKEIPGMSGYFKDDFGVVWNKNGVDKDIGMIEGLVFPEPSMGVYKFPVFDERSFRSRIEKMLEDEKDNFCACSVGFSLFERAWSLRGMENLLIDMIETPEFAEELFDAIVEFNLKIINISLEYDIDGMMFGDDWGQQKGLIMGPRIWRKFIKPRLAKMYAPVKQKGKHVLQHSCGDIYEIFPDLIEVGLDVYQTVQPEIYDLAKLKSEFGKDLTFWGGISTQRLLPFASAEEVKRVVKETIEIMKVGGGYIAGPTHSIPGDVPPENVIVMLQEFEGGK